MSAPVAHIGDEFEGKCLSCDGEIRRGKIITGEFVTIGGQGIAVTGSVGQGYCGHTCTVIGQSESLSINGKQIARIGDPVTGEIIGTIITGSDFVASD